MKINGVVESCLYVADLDRARRFYEEVLGLRRMAGDDRFAALHVAPGSVLLLFVRGATTEPVRIPIADGVIPPHDGSGPQHIGFSIPTAELPEWEARLAANSVEIESRVKWPAGGTSLYFRDPDGNLAELLTPGVWPTY